MKKFILSGLIAFGMLTSQCQVLLNEIQTNGDDIVEIKNHGDMMVDISSYRLCSWPTYTTVGNMTVISGSTNLMPGALVVISGHDMGDNDDELGLYIDNSWTNPASMLDYVEWGSTGHTRSSVAQSAGIWANGDFTEAAPMGTTLAWDGDGNSSANWTVGAEPSFGQENPNGGGGCEGVLGCIDPTACNYDSTADCDDESCTYPEEDYLDCNGECLVDLDEDGICDVCDTWESIVVDCECEFLDPNTFTVFFTNVDEDNCVIIEDCYCECFNDADEDGICDENEIEGCTDSAACNYNSEVTDDDGTCEYETCSGCTDSTALNYDNTATIDDGSCVFDCEYPVMILSVFCEDGESSGFFVEMNIVDLGNGAPYTISNNQNSDITQVSLNGVTNLGPFDNGDQVAITVASELYPDCLFTSPMLTMNCDPDNVVEEVKTTITIYPNPTEGLIQIQTIETVLGIQIYDLAGRLAFESKNKTFNISRLPVGIYTLRIRTENGLAIRRVSKI